MEALCPGQRPPVMRLRVGKTPNTVLNDHDCPVNDDAEVQGPEAHQVGTHLVLDHAREREEHRQGNDHCGDDRCADVPQEKEQDHDHENRAFEQVFLHRADGLVDEHRAVIDRHRMHPLWKALVDLHHLLVYRLGDGPAVFSNQHEHGAENHFPTVVRGSSGSKLPANAHFGHVLDAHGHAVGAAENHVANVLQGFHLARCTDEVLLAALFDVARAHVAVVAIQSGYYVLQRHAQRSQALGDGRDLVFLGEAADGVDFRHARNVAQLWLDDPVLDLAQVGRGVG